MWKETGGFFSAPRLMTISVLRGSTLNRCEEESGAEYKLQSDSPEPYGCRRNAVIHVKRVRSSRLVTTSVAQIPLQAGSILRKIN